MVVTGPYPTVPDPETFADALRPGRRGGDGAERHAAERRVAAVVEGMAEAFVSLDAA